MTMMMKTNDVIEQIKKGQSVENITITDLKETRLSFRDAVLLIEHGFLVPSENIIYRDADIAYDADFDEVEWKGKYQNLQEYLMKEGVINKNKE